MEGCRCGIEEVLWQSVKPWVVDIGSPLRVRVRILNPVYAQDMPQLDAHYAVEPLPLD